MDLLTIVQRRQAGTRENWKRLTGNGIHARLIASKQAPKSALLVLPDNEAPLPLMAEAFVELDAHSWNVTFTTALESSDSVSDFAWVITSASAFSAVQDRCLSRTILRADHPDQLPVPEERPVAQPTSVARGVEQESSSGQAVNVQLQNTPTHASPQRAPLSQQTSHHSSQPSGKRHTSHRPAPPKQRVPILAIVGASVALLIAMVILVIAFMNKGDSGNAISGRDANVSEGQDVQPNQLSDAQEDLQKELTKMGVQKKDAISIAKSVEGGDAECDKWKAYFEALKKVCESKTPWEALAESNGLKIKATQGKLPPWLVELVIHTKKDKKIFSDLADLAQKRDKGSALSLNEWQEFDQVAKLYAGKEPFGKEDIHFTDSVPRKFPNPFPSMARELLRGNLGGKFSAENDTKALERILNLDIWKRPAYTKIPHSVYLRATKGASKIENWEELMKGYERLKSPFGKGKMDGYLGLYKAYKAIEKSWSDDQIPRKKDFQDLLAQLRKDHESKPKCLLEYLQEHVGGDTGKSVAENNPTKINSESRPSKQGGAISRYVYDYNKIKNKGLGTDLIRSFIEIHGDDGTKIKRGWKLMIDGEEALRTDDKIFKGVGGNQASPNVKIDEDKNTLGIGTSPFWRLDISKTPHEESIVFFNSGIKQGDGNSVWEDRKYTLHENDRYLELDGELSKCLNEIKTLSELIFMVEGKQYKFVRTGQIWRILFFPAKPKLSATLRGIKDKPSREAIKVLCERYQKLEQTPKKGAGKGRVDDMKKTIKELHALLKSSLADESGQSSGAQGSEGGKLKKHVEGFFKESGLQKNDYPSFKEDRNHGKLIKFANYIVNLSNQNSGRETTYKQKLTGARSMAKKIMTIEVFSQGLNEKNKLLLVKGALTKFYPAKKK